jgi:hypothetical protein
MEIEMRFTTMTAALVLMATGAMAQDLIEYGEMDGWAIMIDPTVGNGCLMQSDFEDGSSVRVGLNPAEGNGYVAAFNADWGDIADGTAYPVTFLLDEEKYDAEANGMHMGDTPGVVIPFGSEDFLADIIQRNTMTLMSGETEVMVIDLSGTDTAIEEVIACQDAQG